MKINEVQGAILPTKTLPEALQRVQPEQTTPTISGHNEFSIYRGKLDNEVLVQGMARIRVAFPKSTDAFINLLTERIKANKFSNQRLVDAVNHLIDNFQYKELNISDIVNFDKKIKLYTYHEVCHLVTEHKASFTDFEVREFDGKCFRVKKNYEL